MEKQRLVALADILGFKQTVLHTPVDVVVREYFEFFRKAIQHSFELAGWPAAPEDFAQLKARLGMGMEWFSDTLILYALDDADAAITNLLRGVTWLVFETMYFHAVRLRVGIDYGELHVDENAGQFVGKAIVCAHELERGQNWVGGALTTAACERLPASARFYTVEYPVPTKPGAPASTTALNWTQGVHLTFSVPFAPGRAEPDEHDDARVAEKWRNTRTFHDTVCATHRKKR